MARTLIEIRAETSQYQQAMRQAAAEMKNLTAQHSLAAAQAKLNGSAQDGLRAKVTELTSKMGVQKGIIQQNGAQYDNLRQKLDEQKNRHEQLKTQVEAAKKAYEDSAKAAGENGEETKKLKDEYEKLSAQLSTSENQISKTETAITKQEAAVHQSEAALAEMEAELKNVNAELAKAPFEEYAAKAEKVGNTMTSAGKAMMPVTTAIAGVATAAIKTTADFDTSMSKVAAISGATGGDLDKLRDKAREMGSKTKFSAAEAADGMQYMAMAGWKTSDMLDGLEGIMNLAAASGEDLASTSDIVTDALTAFGLGASDSSHFADILAAASSNANTNVSMMGETFKYAAPVLGSLGYSAEDAALAIGMMANSGIKSSQAGTALRSAITNLAKPTDTVAAAMEKYGISLTDSNGKMYSLRELMGQFRDKLGDLSEAEQTNAAASLFGKEAMAGMLAIVNGADSDYEKLASAIDNCDGTSAQMAETMQDNLNGQLTTLMSKVQELAISFGEIMMPTIRDVVTHIQNLIDKLNGMSEGQKKTIATVATFVAAVGPLLLIFGKMIIFTSDVSKGLGTLTAGLKAAGGMSGVATKAFTLLSTGATKVSGMLGGVTSALGFIATPAGIAVVAIGAITAGLVYLWNTNEGFRNAVTGAWEGIKSTFSAGKDAVVSTFKELGTSISEKWQEIKDGTNQKIDEIKESTSQKYNEIKEGMGTIMQAAKDTVAQKLENMKQAYVENGEGTKGVVAAAMEGIKGYNTAGLTFVDNLTGGKLTAVSEKFKSKMEEAKSATQARLNEIKSGFSNSLGNAYSTVSGKLDNIRNAFTNKMNAARDTVKNAIDKIRSFFNFEWSLPKLKMPHISISGHFSLKPPSAPHFSVSWYRNGGIMTQPTVFGTAGNTLLAGGEAGPEAILPLKQFYDRLGEMLDKKIEAITGGTIVQVYVTMDGEVVATKVYSKVEEKIVSEVKRRR